VEISSSIVISIQDLKVSSSAIKPTIVRLCPETCDATILVRFGPKEKIDVMVAYINGIRAENIEYPGLSLIWRTKGGMTNFTSSVDSLKTYFLINNLS